MTFWYRQSPAPLVGESIRSGGRVLPRDPAPLTSGMVLATFAMDGRLLTFSAVPPERVPATVIAQPDWSRLFALAKLSLTDFKPADPEWTPLVTSDARAAWTGMYPGQENVPVRIEAAAFQGKPVYFDIIWPWTQLRRTPTTAEGVAARRTAAQTVYGVVWVLIALAAAVIARMNWKAGRVDTGGANFLAKFVFITGLVSWLLRAHHVSSGAEQTLLLSALADSLGLAAMSWVAYLALEPWVRRYWPHSLIAWSRVVAGRWRDPMVGRDLLCALLIGLISCIYIFFLSGVDGLSLGDFQVNELMGPRAVLQVVSSDLGGTIVGILQYFLLMFLLRLVLRKSWLATTGFVLLYGLYRGFNSGATHWYVAAAFFLPILATVVFVLVRYGLLALILTSFVSETSLDLVMTTDLTAWYGLSSLVMLIILIAMTACGFRLANRQSAFAERCS